MATAYHLEALRRQRLIDRAAEAKQRLQMQEFVDKAVQVGGEESRPSTSASPSKHSQRSRRKSRSADKKVQAILRDLHKQKLTLRNSNLVMGEVCPQDELESELSRRSSAGSF